MLVDIGSCYLNTNHIVSIEPSADGHVVTLITGKTISLPFGGVRPDDFCGTIVPATPGLSLIEALPPGNDETDRTVHFRKTPVLAFRVSARGDVSVPIGCFGEPSTVLGGEYAVILPDGRCFGWEAFWSSVENFKTSQQAAANTQAAPTKPAPDKAAELDPERGL